MTPSIWPSAHGGPEDESSHWVLSSDLWMNMMVAFITLIGGEEILRQTEVEAQQSQEADSEEPSRIIIFVRVRGIQLAAGGRDNSAGPSPEEPWHPHDSLRSLVKAMVGQDPSQDLLVVLDCPAELPIKYLTQCLSQVSGMRGVIPVIR